MDKGDLDALTRLRAAASAYNRAAAEAHRLRSRRDFLIVAAFRRGISIRVIAEAAGVHFSRVGQLVMEARRVATENDLTPALPRKRKKRRT